MFSCTTCFGSELRCCLGADSWSFREMLTEKRKIGACGVYNSGSSSSKVGGVILTPEDLCWRWPCLSPIPRSHVQLFKQRRRDERNRWKTCCVRSLKIQTESNPLIWSPTCKKIIIFAYHTFNIYHVNKFWLFDWPLPSI